MIWHALPTVSRERFHLDIEAGRLAYALRDQHSTDLAAMRVPINDILSKSRAVTLR